MSMIDKLTNIKTRVFSLKLVMKDESIISNNIQIIENIYKNQCEIDDDNSSYREALRLIYEDLKIWQRI